MSKATDNLVRHGIDSFFRWINRAVPRGAAKTENTSFDKYKFVKISGRREWTKSSLHLNGTDTCFRTFEKPVAYRDDANKLIYLNAGTCLPGRSKLANSWNDRDLTTRLERLIGDGRYGQYKTLLLPFPILRRIFNYERNVPIEKIMYDTPLREMYKQHYLKEKDFKKLNILYQGKEESHEVAVAVRFYKDPNKEPHILSEKTVKVILSKRQDDYQSPEVFTLKETRYIKSDDTFLYVKGRYYPDKDMPLDEVEIDFSREDMHRLRKLKDLGEVVGFHTNSRTFSPIDFLAPKGGQDLSEAVSFFHSYDMFLPKGELRSLLLSSMPVTKEVAASLIMDDRDAHKYLGKLRKHIKSHRLPNNLFLDGQEYMDIDLSLYGYTRRVPATVLLKVGSSIWLCSVDEGSYFASKLDVSEREANALLKASLKGEDGLRQHLIKKYSLSEKTDTNSMLLSFLRPAQVTQSLAANKKIARQGEWFFVQEDYPCDSPNLDEGKHDDVSIDIFKQVRAFCNARGINMNSLKLRLALPVTSPLSNLHRGFIFEHRKSIYAIGEITHISPQIDDLDRNGYRGTREHRDLMLETVYRVYRNTELQSFSAGLKSID